LSDKLECFWGSIIKKVIDNENHAEAKRIAWQQSDSLIAGAFYYQIQSESRQIMNEHDLNLDQTGVA